MTSYRYSGTLVFDDGVLMESNLYKEEDSLEFNLAFDWPTDERRYSAHAIAKLKDGKYVSPKFHCKELLSGEKSVQLSSFRFMLEPRGGAIEVRGYMLDEGIKYWFSGTLPYVKI